MIDLGRSSPKIADCLGGRDNNLNLIRIVAACCVVISHAFAIVSGDISHEPLRAQTGESLGGFAVAVFFGASGLLISRSFDRKSNVAHFVAARVLRLWPALIVCLMLTVFVLGPVVTTLPLDAFFASPATWLYVPRVASLAFMQHTLPGVFVDAPLGATINGSLWSLFYEVICYGFVIMIGLAGLLGKQRGFAIFLILAILGHVAAVLLGTPDGLGYRLKMLGVTGFPFALGMAAYVWRDRIILNAWLALGLWFVAIAFARTVFFVSMIELALVYSAFWFGFAVKGPLLAYNRLGDYSYGVYVYGYPVQQMLVHFFPHQSGWANLLAAMPICLFLAWLSWTLVEHQALGLARPTGDWLTQLAQRLRPGSESSVTEP